MRVNKYHNKPAAYNGRVYRSQKEAAFAWECDQRLKLKEITAWHYEPKIELKGEHGNKICIYKIDFALDYADGHIEYVEVKGFETPVWRLKWKLFEDKFGHDAHYVLRVLK